jgi:hypothetical protein
MMAKWWLVTCTTYGSWLPGDPRGFQTYRGREYVPPPARYAKPGEPTYDAAPYRQRWEKARQVSSAMVKLSLAEVELVLPAIVKEVNLLPLIPRILAVDNTHLHLIAQFGALLIRPTMGRLKSAGTGAIPNPGDRPRVWTDGCHMKSLPNRRALETAIAYVQRHAAQGALVYEWNSQV